MTLRAPLVASWGLWCSRGGILALIDHRRGQGLDPLEGGLLDDVGPLPLGGKLPAALIELVS